MPEAGKSSLLRSWLFFSGIFLAGIAAGVLGSLALDLAGQKTQAVFPVARWLDVDFLHLKSGKMIAGHILSRSDQELILEIQEGTLKFRPDEIDRIEENYYTRYFKKVW